MNVKNLIDDIDAVLNIQNPWYDPETDTLDPDRDHEEETLFYINKCAKVHEVIKQYRDKEIKSLADEIRDVISVPNPWEDVEEFDLQDTIDQSDFFRSIIGDVSGVIKRYSEEEKEPCGTITED